MHLTPSPSQSTYAIIRGTTAIGLGAVGEKCYFFGVIRKHRRDHSIMHRLICLQRWVLALLTAHTDQQLSDGQKRRVAVVRAVTSRTEQTAALIFHHHDKIVKLCRRQIVFGGRKVYGVGGIPKLARPDEGAAGRFKLTILKGAPMLTQIKTAV